MTPGLTQIKKGTPFSILALILFSLAAALFAGEIAVRILMPQELIVSAGIWKREPKIGWRHFPMLDTKVNTGEGKVRFVTDEHGYRINSSEDEARKRKPADLSILVLGDSFIEGLAVENRETIPQKLRQMLEAKYDRSVRAVNAGVGLWQPAQYLMEAERALSEAEYDAGVVFFYVVNDSIESIQHEFNFDDFERRRSIKLPQRFTLKEIKAEILYPINNYLEERSHLFVFIKKRFSIVLAKLGLSPYYFPEIYKRSEKDSLRWELTAEIAGSIEKTFERFSVPVFFVLLPADYQVDPTAFARHLKMFSIPEASVDLEQPNRRLRETFNGRGLRVVDALDFLYEQHQNGHPVYGTVDNHLNQAGHRLVAEKIFPVVEEYLKPKLMEKGPL